MLSFKSSLTTDWLIELIPSSSLSGCLNTSSAASLSTLRHLWSRSCSCLDVREESRLVSSCYCGFEAIACCFCWNSASLVALSRWRLSSKVSIFASSFFSGDGYETSWILTRGTWRWWEGLAPLFLILKSVWLSREKLWLKESGTLSIIIDLLWMSSTGFSSFSLNPLENLRLYSNAILKASSSSSCSDCSLFFLSSSSCRLSLIASSISWRGVYAAFYICLSASSFICFCSAFIFFISSSTLF